MNIAKLHGENPAHVIDATIGLPQESLDVAYFRGINLGLVAANLIRSQGFSVGGGYASIYRNVARDYATREAMASAYPSRFVAHQRPATFVDVLRSEGYEGNEVFPSIVIGFNSYDVSMPDAFHDMYERPVRPAHERIVGDIALATIEPKSLEFIKEFFEIG